MKKILLVDDSPTMVTSAYDELDERGYLVEVAYNGQLALKRLAELGDDLPDLIVMDIEMPKMRGDEAAKVIRSTPGWSHLPIIALSGTSPDALGPAAQLFNNYLIKPFGFDQMLILIEKLIGPPD